MTAPSSDGERKTAIVLGVTADIGMRLAELLIGDGWYVIGLGRDLSRSRPLEISGSATLLPCDLTDAASVADAIETVRTLHRPWQLFISSAGTMEPIGSFFTLDFAAFEKNLQINVIGQLHLLHGLWPLRDTKRMTDIMLMAGGGTNGPFRNYSAYCLSKIALIKMVELIHDETPDVNAFIIGPGFTRTRIHEETLRAGHAAGTNLARTEAFLADKREAGTSLEDIYHHMRWCMTQGRDVAGGRNFSTVHDPWRSHESTLKDRLRGDPDAFRLRRHPANS